MPSYFVRDVLRTLGTAQGGEYNPEDIYYKADEGRDGIKDRLY